MELENVFTHAVDGRSRYFEMNAGEDADFVINCHIEVFCMPDDADEDEEDAAYENPEFAEKIGVIEGQLVLGTEMMKFGENVYNQCDDAGANTEFIYSALMENGGPLSEDQYCIQMGVRCPGESYPAAAKDKAVWERYERNGFEEWKDTRVLYKNI